MCRNAEMSFDAYVCISFCSALIYRIQALKAGIHTLYNISLDAGILQSQCQTPHISFGPLVVVAALQCQLMFPVELKIPQRSLYRTKPSSICFRHKAEAGILIVRSQDVELLFISAHILLNTFALLTLRAILLLLAVLQVYIYFRCL